MTNRHPVNNKNGFKYKGLTFIPYRQLRTSEADFQAVSRQLRDIKITPPGWNWNKFYLAAKKANPENAQIDLFICNGHVVIPCAETLFAYKE